MKVCILGCGPAGLLSAFACDAMYHHKVYIVSKKVKSQIPGAVFLHEPIDNITALQPEGVVMFQKFGTKAGYAKKVYGRYDAECSWDSFPEGGRPAWSMFALYDKLWSYYEPRVSNRVIDHRYIGRLLHDFDLIISTIPAQFICHNPEHKFESQGIYILDKSVQEEDNVIVYNGSMADPWYRTSKIFGFESTESTVPFPGEYLELNATMSQGYKPLWTDCDCYPQIHRVGRFGQWKKGVLVHHAYKQTVQIMEALK